MYKKYLNLNSKLILLENNFNEQMNKKEIININDSHLVVYKNNKLKIYGDSVFSSDFKDKINNIEKELKKDYSKIFIKYNIKECAKKNIMYLEEDGYEDLYCLSSFVFNNIINVENKIEYKFTINNYMDLKEVISSSNNKDLFKINLENNILCCYDNTNLIAISEYHEAEFLDLGRVTFIDEIYIFNKSNEIIENIINRLIKSDSKTIVYKTVCNNNFRNKYINNLYEEEIFLYKCL